MHEVATYFEDFLSEISPTDQQCDEMDAAHRAVINHLRENKLLKYVWVKSFVQGSYRRDTGLIGSSKHPCDIDVVVVTKLPDVLVPGFALELFNTPIESFCAEQNANPSTKMCHKLQGRSWGITVSPEINLDIVPTSSVEESWTVPLVDDQHTGVKFASEDAAGGRSMLALMEENFSFRGARAQARRIMEGYSPGAPAHLPAAAQQIRAFLKNQARAAEAKTAGVATSTTAGGTPVAGALRIPDHNSEKWVATHPLGQIAWTTEKNERCNGHFTKVVRSLKWWKRECLSDCEKPKGYPLERLIADCCPDDIKSVAEGVAKTLAEIIRKYGAEIDQGICPKIADHGTTADVWKRIEVGDWRKFLTHVRKAHEIAQRAINATETRDAVEHWHELFGDKFPEPPKKSPVSPAVPTRFSGADNAKNPTPKTYA